MFTKEKALKRHHWKKFVQYSTVIIIMYVQSKLQTAKLILSHNERLSVKWWNALWTSFIKWFDVNTEFRISYAMWSI